MGTENLRKKVATFLEFAALSVLLPMMVLDSISKTGLTHEALFAVVAGFALPLLTIGSYYLSKSIRARRGIVAKYDNELCFMSGTFGGGSRGTALLTLLLAGSIELPDYMKWFALVDLGNFSCLLLVIAPLINRTYSTPTSAGTWDRIIEFLRSYLFITFVVCAAYLAFRSDLPVIDEMLSSSSHDRRLAFTMVVFWAITLRFKADFTQTFYFDLVNLAVARGICGIVTTFFLWWFSVPTPVLLGVILLLLMPPSSALPSIVSNAGAPEDSRSYVSTFSIAFNLVYLILVVFGFAVALSR